MEAFVIGLSLEAFRLLGGLLLAETIHSSVRPQEGGDLREMDIQTLDASFAEECTEKALRELHAAHVILITDLNEKRCQYMFLPEREWGVEPDDPRGVCEPSP